MQADKLLKEIAELKHYHQMGLQKANQIEMMIRNEVEGSKVQRVDSQAVNRRNNRVKITPNGR
jgi:hypothetical protein